MLTRKLPFSTVIYLSYISCFGDLRSANAAALIADQSPAKYELNIYLDQHLEQKNQTEAEPDLSPPQIEPAPATNSSHTDTSEQHHNQHGFISAMQVIKESFGRQDVGEEVGEKVGTIVSGVLGGGLTNVFQGSSSFIGNVNAQEEVDFVLNNVAPPFETLLNYGFDGLKQYFGIGQTTVKTVVVTHAPQEQLYLQPIVYENGSVQYIPIYHTVTKPPTVLTVTSPPVEENELELGDVNFNHNYNNNKDTDYDAEKYPLLVKSRVDRLHLH